MLGRSDRAAWGLCRGSGANPYQVIVDLAGPAFRCSCPSRKFPCKHGFGLLLLLATDPAAFPAGTPPDWATEWLDSRDSRAAAQEARTASKPAEVDEAARARRAENREQRIAAGLDEFERWLVDLVRRGLLAAKGEGYRFWDDAGARLVDAQAPALGRGVRAFAGIAYAGEAWGDRALEHAARLHLTVEAYRRLDDLPDALRHDVRSRVGWTVKEDELSADAAVTDRWLCVGRTVDVDERLTTARTWLIGEATGRWALHLGFTPGGTPPPVALPGASVRGAIVFHPSATPLRVAVPDPLAADAPVTGLPGAGGLSDAAGKYAEVLAANPFVESWPVALSGVVPLAVDDRLVLRDATGAVVPAAPPGVAQRVVALAGGHPIDVVGLWSGRALRLLSALADGRLVDLAAGAEGAEGPGAGSAASGRTATRDDAGDRWSRLVSTALLGTERRGDADPDGSDTSGDDPITTALSDRPPETWLLASAAIAATRRRAGWRPPIDASPLPEPAPPDPRPAVPPQAAWHLGRILDERPELLPEWLGLVAPTRLRPPDEELPRLLARAVRDPAIKRALAPLLGSRARWLAGVLQGFAPAFEADDPGAAWETADRPAQRALVLRAIRRGDPAAGRALLGSVWADLSPDDRAATIDALAEGLGLADEPLLERARGDRRAEVRSAATSLLARLEGSAYRTAVEREAEGVLVTTGRIRAGIHVRPPAWSDTLEHIGLTRKPPQGIGEQAWWLRQLIGLVAPSRWEAWLGADPAALLDRAIRSDQSVAIVGGWYEATARHADERWTHALLADRRTLAADSPYGDVVELIDVLDGRGRESATLALLRTKPDAARAARVLRGLPAPWSRDVARGVLDVIAPLRDVVIPAELPELARLAGRALPPAFADELEELLDAGDHHRLAAYPVLRQPLDVLRFREQMAAALRGSQETSR